MIKGKRALLSLAIFISIASPGQAAEDWLGGSMGISDVHNTAEYIAKVGSAQGSGTKLNSSDGGIATVPIAAVQQEVYSIGKAGSSSEAVASEEAIEPSNFSGRWSLAITEKSTRSLDLALYQTGDLVFGKGVLGSSESSEAGGSSSEDRGIDSMIEWLNLPPSSLESASQAAASGTVEGDRLHLDLISLESLSLYRFELNLTGDLVSGSYSAYGTDGSTWAGTATGARRA